MVYKNNSHRGCPYMTPDGKRGGGSAKSDFILIGALAKHLMRRKRGQKKGHGQPHTHYLHKTSIAVNYKVSWEIPIIFCCELPKYCGIISLIASTLHKFDKIKENT